MILPSVLAITISKDVAEMAHADRLWLAWNSRLPVSYAMLDREMPESHVCHTWLLWGFDGYSCARGLACLARSRAAQLHSAAGLDLRL